MRKQWRMMMIYECMQHVNNAMQLHMSFCTGINLIVTHSTSHRLPNVPGYHAHKGLRCKSALLLPTRISKSWIGWWPQQLRVVIRTTRTVCADNKSTRHHGDGSFCVSEHCCSSGFSLPNLPSLAMLAGPARVVDDWFTGLRNATFVPEKFELHSCS